MCPFIPYPPDSGGKVVAYHYFKGLAEHGHRMTLVAPLRRPHDQDCAASLRQYGEVIDVEARADMSFARIASAVVRGESVRIARHRFPRVAERVASELTRHHYDAAILDSLFTAYLCPRIRDVAPKLPIFLLEHNFESQLVRRYAARSSPLVRSLALIEAARLRRREVEALRAVTEVIALSEKERFEMSKLAPDARLTVIPPGVTTHEGEEFSPPAHPARCLFLGSFRWAPNRDAAQWLAKELFPAVRARVPRAELALAGEAPPSSIRALEDARGGVSVFGDVPDAAEMVRASAVSLVPLRVAGGVRIKILESLANERPVVTTSQGCEGLPFLHEEHLLIADGNNAFVESVVRILSDDVLAAALARRGRSLVEEKFAWPGIIEALEEMLVRHAKT